MILYRKEPYPLQMKNIMLLDDVKSGGVVYVNKATYDQALMLSSRFDGSVKRVADALKTKKTEAYIATVGLPNLIEEMGKSMPEPINILAPFLMYCVANQGIEWDSSKRELAYGILHQYSQLIDFNAMLLVPPEVRSNVSFPTSVLLQYETSWNDLCSTLRDKLVEFNQPAQQVWQVSAPAQQTVSTVPVQQPAQQTVQPTQPAQPVQTAQPVQQAQPVQVSQSDTPKVKTPDGEREMTPIEKKIYAMRERMMKEDEEEKKKRAEEQAKKATEKKKPEAPSGSGINEAANKEKSNSVLDAYDC